jgi:putative aldouronate transport system permease protein
MLINRIGSLLSVGYEKVYLLYNTSTWETADVVSTLAMRWGGIAGGGNSGGIIAQAMASAAEMLNNLTGMILVIGANTIARKVSDVSLY